MPVNKEASGTDQELRLLQESRTFLHQARPVPALLPSEVEHIARRLKRHPHRPRRGFLWPALATVALVLIGGGTVAVAKGGLGSLPVIGPLLGPFLGPLFVSTPAATRAKPAKRQPSEQHPEVKAPPLANPGVPLPAIPPTPVFEPLKLEAAQSHPIRPTVPYRRDVALRSPREMRERANLAPLPDLSVPPAAADQPKDPRVEESQSFAAIIGSWHRTHNASATLMMLDAHERRYPSGDMRLESRVLRAEINLAQGREMESLRVLDTLSLAGLPRARELQVVRGELRVKFGRCAEGKRDFDEVLAKGIADPLGERAARAMSRCP